MKLQDQVCRLQQSKKLNQLGIIQGGSVFYFDTEQIDVEVPIFNSGFNGDGQYFNAETCFAAFNVAELGIMCNSETYTWRTGSENSEYAHWEWIDEGNTNAMGVYATEAEARAEMLIYLLKNNLVTAGEVNARLTQTT